MIVLDKYYKDSKLEEWHHSFKNVRDLIRFMKKNKLFILGKGYKLEIKEFPDIDMPKFLFKKEEK